MSDDLASLVSGMGRLRDYREGGATQLNLEKVLYAYKMAKRPGERLDQWLRRQGYSGDLGPMYGAISELLDVPAMSPESHAEILGSLPMEGRRARTEQMSYPTQQPDWGD